MKNMIQLMFASAALITALSLTWLTLTATGLFGYWHTPLVRHSVIMNGGDAVNVYCELAHGGSISLEHDGSISR